MLARATTGPAYRSSLHYTAGSHDPVRVASYNVLSYATSGRPSWESRRGYVVSTIAKQAPDVIGIQEVSQGTMRNSTLTQYDDLVARLGDPYRLTNAARYNCKVTTSRSNCTYRNQGASQANRIIYNANTLVLLAQGSMRLERLTSKDNERYLAWAKFRQITTGKVFLFATTHLQSNQGSSTTVYNKTYHYLRVRQAKAISAELNRVGGSLPKMLTGDMNTRWNSPDRMAPTPIRSTTSSPPPVAPTCAIRYAAASPVSATALRRPGCRPSMPGTTASTATPEPRKPPRPAWWEPTSTTSTFPRPSMRSGGRRC